jgi:hypothetical protein
MQYLRISYNILGYHTASSGVMAKGDKIPSSASVENSDNKTSESESKIEKSSFLFYNVNNFT